MENSYPFNAPCPVVGCPNQDKNKRFQWYHKKDNKKMYVNEQAELFCENGHKSPMLDWRFKCENHDYQPASSQGLLFALSILAQLEKIDPIWLLNNMDLISNQTRRALQAGNFDARNSIKK